MSGCPEQQATEPPFFQHLLRICNVEQMLKQVTLAVVIGFLCWGCAPRAQYVWQHNAKGPQEFRLDQAACTRQAEAAYPMPRMTYDPMGNALNSIDGWYDGEYDPYGSALDGLSQAQTDTNARLRIQGLRSTFVRRCLQSRGYFLVRR